MKSVRLFDIPLKIDYSIIPLAVLNIYYLMNYTNGGLPLWVNIVFSIVTTALLFGSVVLHEVTHALVARSQGIRTIEMKINLFGGYAKFAEDFCTPMSEFKIYASGPISNLILGTVFLFCYLFFQLVGNDSQILLTLGNNFRLLGWLNIILAVFNLLPGMPLDGGIALRALLRNKGKDPMMATRIPVKIGICLGYLLVTGGILFILYGLIGGNVAGSVFPAIWLLFIGYYLIREADYVYKLESGRHINHEPCKLPGTVGEVMRESPTSVLPEYRIREFIDQVLTNNPRTIFPVARDGRLHGILSLTRLREIPEEKWDQMKISDVMEPISSDLFVTAKSRMVQAAEKINSNNIGYLAVIDQDGYLIGDLFEADLKQLT